jgi:hydrogenase maturation factor
MSSNRFRDTRIALAHGNGGRMMRELIDEVFAASLANPSSTPVPTQCRYPRQQIRT